MSKIIEIENLSKDYKTGFLRKKKVRALDGLNLSVESGQIFGFFGRKWRGENDYDQASNAFDLPHGRIGKDSRGRYC